MGTLKPQEPTTAPKTQYRKVQKRRLKAGAEGVSTNPTMGVGVRVTVKDLVGRPDLNGCVGNLIAYWMSEERWQVKLDSHEHCKMIREANLQKVDFSKAATGIFILRAAPRDAHFYILSTGVDVVDEGLCVAVNETQEGHLCFVTHDDVASECDTVDQLADVYANRIKHEYLSKEGFRYGPIIIIGDSFAAEIAHEVILRLQQAGENVQLGLYTQDWLDASTRYLVEGAREWMGGNIEGLLLVARALGAFTWADTTERSLMKGKGPKPDAEELMMRLYFDVLASKNVGKMQFEDFVGKCCIQYQKLNDRMETFEPSDETFAGASVSLSAPQRKSDLGNVPPLPPDAFK